MALRVPRQADTPLNRELVMRRRGEKTVSRPAVLDAFRLARRTFLDGNRVDMQGLARELEVDRATLYRWVGSREQLLAEIFYSLIEPTVRQLKEAYCDLGKPTQPGQSPLAAVIAGTVSAVIDNEGMQNFIEHEGDLALRLLTTKAFDFEQRMVGLATELIKSEKDKGRLISSVPYEDLPYVVVRIMESYAYAGLITGEHPDSERAGRVINALLPSADSKMTATHPS